MKMKKLFIVTLLLVAGCSAPYRIVAINQQDMFRIPANARVEWQDSKDVDGDLFFTDKPGWFICDDVLNKIYEVEAQEDITPSIWDRLWKAMGL